MLSGYQRFLALLGILLFGAAFGESASGALAPSGSRAARPQSADRVLVRWKTAAPPSQSVRFPVLRTHRQTATSVVRVPRGSTPEATLAALRADPRVLYAGPSVRRRLLTLAQPNEPTWTATDPQPDYFTRSLGSSVPEPNRMPFLWALQTVRAHEAWSVYPNQYFTAQTKPNNPVRVAVLDTGLDLSHPEWINAGGTSPDAKLGGQIDMANAVTFLDGATEPVPLTDDNVGHGTHITGIIAAAANNGGNPGEGAIGLAYGVQIMPIQVLDSADGGFVDDIISGIYYAVDHGAQIISISLGDYEYSPFEQDAIDYAWANNVLVVAAAGNDGDAANGGQNRIIYPAACNRVLAVAATDMDDQLASYSNYGNYVGIAAPGGDAHDAGVVVDFFGIPLEVPTQFAVYSTTPTHPFELQVQSDGMGGTITDYMTERYDYAPGTSTACPLVSGLAALYAQKNGITRGTPNAAAILYQAVQRAAVNIKSVPGGGWSQIGGFGRIDALNTLLDVDTRSATVGCIVGKVTSFGNAAGSVAVTASNGSITRNATTRADGGFRLTNLPPGRWTVTAGTVTGSGSLKVDVLPGVDNFGAEFAFPWPYGDVAPNGRVELPDAVAALRMITGADPMESSAVLRADISPWAGTEGRLHGDGRLNMDDVRAILRLASGVSA